AAGQVQPLGGVRLAFGPREDPHLRGRAAAGADGPEAAVVLVGDQRSVARHRGEADGIPRVVRDEHWAARRLTAAQGNTHDVRSAVQLVRHVVEAAAVRGPHRPGVHAVVLGDTDVLPTLQALDVDVGVAAAVVT